MKLQTYAIYDSKAKVFSHPFYCQNNEVAIRNFVATAEDKTTSICKYPEDFSLHHIGEYDDETAAFVSQTPINLGLAAQFQTTKE